ncbi:hypothetical protein FO519_001886 [Halicephalobus sp. NKZ332]|nr:hypothetical protein FO519_001886 [Halicephalobus sp. NKZ332]
MTEDSSSSTSSGSHSREVSKTFEKRNYVFDPNDDFYLAPPAAQLLHYRTAAMVAGVLEVLVLVVSVFVLLHFYLHIGLTGFYSSLTCIAFLIVAIITTTVMITGILQEKPHFMIPQILFLKIEIFTLLVGVAFSIASMSLGMDWSRIIFSPIVNVPLMEGNFGPIWPFNLATISFCGAALGIWFHEIVEGCHEYLLDKQYFDEIQGQEIELQNNSIRN